MGCFLTFVCVTLTWITELGNNPTAYSRKGPVKLVLENANRESANSNKQSPAQPEYSIDPLSHVGTRTKTKGSNLTWLQHILKRTNTENTIPLKLQRPSAQPDVKSNIDVEVPTSIAEESIPRRSTVADSLRADSLNNKDKK